MHIQNILPLFIRHTLTFLILHNSRVSYQYLDTTVSGNDLTYHGSDCGGIGYISSVP
ncbi:hypothetical protein D3C76_1692700 [compost metagenome]